MAKLVGSLQSVRNGVVVTASFDRLYTALIADGVSMFHGMVYKKNLVSSEYKNPSSIYVEVLKSVNADSKNDIYVDILAQNFINTVCETNRLAEASKKGTHIE